MISSDLYAFNVLNSIYERSSGVYFSNLSQVYSINLLRSDYGYTGET